MHLTLLVGLSLVTVAAGDGLSIPQDKPRMEQRARDRLEWNRRTLQGDYEKIGKKDPRWDKPALEALDLAARMFSEQSDPVVTLADIQVPAKKAFDAGCKDPMILYLYARTSLDRKTVPQEEFVRRLQAAADAMSASGYCPYRRAVAILKPLEAGEKAEKLDAEALAKVEKGVDAALGLLPLSATQDVRSESWEAGWFMTTNAAIAVLRSATGDYKAAYDRVDARLAKVPGIEALRSTVKGQFYINWGWEARTKAFAVNVTEQQFRTFETRLIEARAALNEAWAAKPGEPHVASLMMTIEKGIGNGDYDTMTRWFTRAMESNGDDQEACWQMLDWLDPKWFGGPTPDPMIEFGRACLATKNWRARITLLAGDAHFRSMSSIPQPQRAQWMKNPEIWADIQEVYDEYLKHIPLDNIARSKYATLAFLTAHYPEAHAQYQILGDQLTPWAATPNYPLETMKRMRDTAAQRATSKPADFVP